MLLDARASVEVHIGRLLLPTSVVIRALNSPLANFDVLQALDNAVVYCIRLGFLVQVMATLIHHESLISHWVLATSVV